MEELIDRINSRHKPANNEYIGQDGLLHCSVCHKPTECRLEPVAGLDFLANGKIVRCICDCQKAELDRQRKIALHDEIARKRKVCFNQTNMANWTFANDDRRNEKLSDAMKRYAEKFPEFLKDGKGLLLHGTVGTGKTYFAACIANYLLDQNRRVLMTNFARLTNDIQGMFEGKQQYIDDLNRYQLLIIDDLGAERKSEFMQEMVFNIIDSRYRSGLPFIVTTNLTADEIKKPQEVSYQRIYDRILERCFPIAVEGGSRRRAALKNTHAEVKAMLGL